MANKPELSIKVNVDPVVNGDKLVEDINNQVQNVKKLPKVQVDVDVGNFSQTLSDKMKTELKEVNKKLDYYLSSFVKYSDNLNKVAGNLFADIDLSDRIKKQFSDVYTEFDNFKRQLADNESVMKSIFDNTEFSSVDDFSKALSKVQKEFNSLYNKSLKIDKDTFNTKEFEDTFHKAFSNASVEVENLLKLIENLSNLDSDKDFLKKLGMSQDDFYEAIGNIESLGDSLSNLVELNNSKNFTNKGIKEFFATVGKSSIVMENSFKDALSDVTNLESAITDKYKKLEEERKKITDKRDENLTGGFDKEKIDSIAKSYAEVLSVLVAQQQTLNTAKKETLTIENSLLEKTTSVSQKMQEEINGLKALFKEVGESDFGKQIPALSDYMKSKAEIDANKNIENAKTISFSASADKAQAYETALGKIKEHVNYLGGENSPISKFSDWVDGNESSLTSATTAANNYVRALDDLKQKSQGMKLPQQRTTGLNTDNINAYSEKVSGIKTDLLALKDTVFPNVYNSINETYGNMFGTAIANAETYIETLEKIPTAAQSKMGSKNQAARKSESLDSTNIKNYATLLSGIQTGISDMKISVIPDFDKVLNDNGQKLAQLGLVLKNYIDTYKKGVKAVSDLENGKSTTKKTEPKLVSTLNESTYLDKTKKSAADKVAVPSKSSLKTKDVTVSGDPVDIPGKVTLTKDNVVPPTEPVDIKGRVTLAVKDVVVPKTPVDIPGKVVPIKDSPKKSKKKSESADSVQKPNPIEMSGKITVTDENVIRPDPVKLNGKIELTKADIKVPESIDLKGNLILKNAEIAEAIKKSTGESKSSSTKKKNKAKNENAEPTSTDISRAAKINRLGQLNALIAENNTQWQSRISDDSVFNREHFKQKNKSYVDESNEIIKDLISTLKAEERKAIEKIYGKLDWDNPSKLAADTSIDWPWEKDRAYVSGQKKAYWTYDNYNTSKQDEAYRKNEAEYVRLLKQEPDLIHAVGEARRKYGVDSNAYRNAQKNREDNHVELVKLRSELREQNPDRERNPDGFYSKRIHDAFNDVLKKSKGYRNRVIDSNTAVQQAADKKAQDDALAKNIALAKSEFEDEKSKLFKYRVDAKNLGYKTNGEENNELVGLNGLINKSEKRLAELADYLAGILPDDELDKLFDKFARAKETLQDKLDQIDRHQKDLETVRNNKNASALAKDQVSRTDKLNINLARKRLTYSEDKYEGATDVRSKLDIVDTKVEALNNQKVSTKEYTVALEDAEKALTDANNVAVVFSNTQKNLDKEVNKAKQNAISWRDSITGDTEEANTLRATVQKLIDTLDRLPSDRSSTSFVESWKNARTDIDSTSVLIDQYQKNNKNRQNSVSKMLKAVHDKQKKLDDAGIHDYDGLLIDKKDENGNSVVDQSKNFEVRLLSLTKLNSQTEEYQKLLAGIQDEWQRISLDIDDVIKKQKEAKNTTENQTIGLFKKYETLLNQLNTFGERYAKAQGKEDPYKVAELLSTYKQTQSELTSLDNQFLDQGFWKADSEHLQTVNSLYQSRIAIENHVAEAINKRKAEQQDSIKVTQKEVGDLDDVIGKLNKVQDRLRNAGGTDSDTYANVVNFKTSTQTLRDQLNDTVGLSNSDKNKIALDWAKNNGLSGLKDYKEVLSAINDQLVRYREQTDHISSDKSFRTSTTKNRTELANLQSQLYDYLKKFPSVESEMSDKVMQLRQALAAPNAFDKIGSLKQSFAELRHEAKELGLETESLVDKFKNLFGQHLSTMITMAALHKMQDALRVVYQNVVEIDTALTELRKVTDETEATYSKFMDTAIEKASALGASISDFINSTAEWSRLGYSLEDSQELAQWSTVLSNIGDGINSASDAASYLVSIMKGFEMTADQAEHVVDVLNNVGNNEPISESGIAEALVRSAAALHAAGNSYEESVALITSANSVLQDPDTVGTTMRTISMYLRAAKTEAESLGEDTSEMADSVSKLRDELKSLTGVDIMQDAAGTQFKSTYEILKEISAVWDKLTDVSQANVTNLLGGKVYPYVQQCA